MTLRNLDVAIALAVVMLGVSLMITILTQVVANALALRGRTLREGLTILFETVYPGGGAHAEAIAHEILTHEMISDSALPEAMNDVAIVKNLRLATALHVNDLIGMLESLAPAAAPAAVADGGHAVIAPTKDQVIGELARRAGSFVAREKTAIAGRRETITSWFNTAMDRASQKFVMKTRIITIVCSILVAFALHLDTFHLLSQLSADPELRAGLVGASQMMQRQAAALSSGPAASANNEIHVPQAYNDALTAVDNEYKSLSGALSKAGAPPRVTTREAGERWLRKAMDGDPKIDEAVAKYQDAVNKAATSPTDKLLDGLGSIRSSLDVAGFQMIPDPYHSWDFWPATKGFWPWDNLHFWGIVFSAGLLSLGAPFWFNALKTLSSLRPVVADKADEK